MQGDPVSFENEPTSGGFAAAVVLPPLFYWGMVAGVAGPLWERDISVAQFLVLAGLAGALPLLALAWTCFSICATSIERGRLVVHRVAFDRAWALSEVELTTAPGPDGTLRLRAGQRSLRLRPDRPELFVRRFRDAQRYAQGGGGTGAVSP